MNEREMSHYRMRELASEDVCLAFSGGVDSSLFLKLATNAVAETGRWVYTVILDSKLHPSCDLEITRRVADELGGIYQVIKVDELGQEEICFSSEDRCYPYKRHLFMTLKDPTREEGVRWILGGINEDDMHVHRPGIHALKELGIISPLAELHIIKEMIKEMAAKYNTPMVSRPSTPCMTTRLPYNTKIDYEMLKWTTHEEEYLKSVLEGNIWLRLHGRIVGLEADQSASPNLLEMREKVVHKLRMLGFIYVILDMEGFRSGSMDMGTEEDRQEAQSSVAQFLR